jgi:hypothetical protein
VNGQHDARLPGLAHDHVKPVHPPYRDHVRHAAAADEDDVLGQQQVLGVGDVRHREQGQVADPGLVPGEQVVHPQYPAGIITRRRVQQAHPGIGPAGQPHRVVQVHGDPAARHQHAAADRYHVPTSVCRHAWHASCVTACKQTPDGFAP